MHLLAPWWWLLLIPLAAGIILLYLLKLRRRDFVVPSVFLWEQALQDLQANAPLQKLRKNLLLLLQLLIVFLVIFGLTRPAMSWRRPGGRSVVLVIDASASMQSTDVKPSRFAAAKREGHRAVEALGPRDRMMIIAVGGATRALTPFTTNTRDLHDALDHLQPTDASADLRGALDLAAGLTNGKNNTEPVDIAIISDGAIPAVNLPADFRLPIHFVQVGRGCDNVGIVMMSVRRRLSKQGGFEGLITLKNYSKSAKQFTLELSLDDQLLDARELTLVGGAARTDLLQQLPARPGVLQARLDLHDDLTVDNAAQLVLPRVDPVAVTLVTTGNLFLTTALSLDPTLTVTQRATPPNSGARGTVLVLDNVPMLAAPGVPALCFGGVGGAQPAHLRRVVQTPVVADWDRRHPVMSSVDLSDVHITEAMVVELPSGAESLVETSAGPIAYTLDRAGQRLVYLGWNLHASDLPLNAAFPIFMANCVDWLSGQQHRAQAVNVRTGEIVPVVLPSDAYDASLRRPDGGIEALPTNGGMLSLDQVTRAGVYQVSAKTASGKHDFSLRFAANLLNAEESDLTPRRELALAGRGEQITATAGPVQTEREIWRIMLLIALAVLCLEWWVFHRRIG